MTGGDIADTAPDTADAGAIEAWSGGDSAGACGVAGAAVFVGALEVIDEAALASAAAGSVGVEAATASAGGVVCAGVGGAGIACAARDGGDGSDSSAHALIGSTRATAPTAAMASGRTRAGVNRQRNPVFVSSR